MTDPAPPASPVAEGPEPSAVTMDARAPGREVLLAWPHADQVAAEFMLCVLAVTNEPGTPVARVLGFRTGPFLAMARGTIAAEFVRSGLDWLWLVDADMTFTPLTLRALLGWASPEAAPVVGALCRTMTSDGNITTTVYRSDPDEAGRAGFTSMAEPDLPPDTLMRVDATGAACLLIHRSVFARLDERWPDPPGLWFAEQVVDGRPFGEDLSFCMRLADAGIPLHVHTGVQVGHLKMVQIGVVSP